MCQFCNRPIYVLIEKGYLVGTEFCVDCTAK